MADSNVPNWAWLTTWVLRLFDTYPDDGFTTVYGGEVTDEDLYRVRYLNIPSIYV